MKDMETVSEISERWNISRGIEIINKLFLQKLFLVKW